MPIFCCRILRRTFKKPEKKKDKQIKYHIFQKIKFFFNFRQYEQAGFIANEAKDYNLVYELIEQSADLMLLTGTRDSAGIILERAAKYCFNFNFAFQKYFNSNVFLSFVKHD